jgi:hypothetical protein
MLTVPVPLVMVLFALKVISCVSDAILIVATPEVVMSLRVMLAPVEVMVIFPPSFTLPVVSMPPLSVIVSDVEIVTAKPVAPVATIFPEKVAKLRGALTVRAPPAVSVVEKVIPPALVLVKVKGADVVTGPVKLIAAAVSIFASTRMLAAVVERAPNGLVAPAAAAK